jgi:hypothetical protein
MSDGFEVDLTSLVRAAEGVNGVITDMQDNKVSDIDGSGADYGDGGLASVLADFCARWQVGVEHLTSDVQQVADRLTLSAQAYAEAERTNVSLISGLLREQAGTDPAASSW